MDRHSPPGDCGLLGLDFRLDHGDPLSHYEHVDNKSTCIDCRKRRQGFASFRYTHRTRSRTPRRAAATDHRPRSVSILTLGLIDDRARPPSARAIKRRHPWDNASGCGHRLLACTLGGRLLGRSFHAYLTTKAKRLSQARPLCRVIRRYDRIIALQAKGGAILARAQLMGRSQVPLKRLRISVRSIGKSLLRVSLIF